MGSDEYEKRVEREAATRVAAETLRHVAADDWHAEREFMRKARGDRDITINEVVEAIGTKTERAFNIAMQVLVDNALHAPTAAERRKSAEVIAKVSLAERELKAKYLETYRALDNLVEMPGEEVKPKKATAGEEKAAPLPELPQLPPMTEEQLTTLIQMRRKKLL